MSTVSLICFVCKKGYEFPLNFYNLRKRRSPNAHDFCSHTCNSQFRTLRKEIPCDNCSKLFFKKLSQINKTKKHFCTQRCSGIYKNKNKTFGFRRSKIEIFLEEKIKNDYPYLKCIFNDRKTIGTELDILFIDLNLAFQINGIVHYKPIYGLDKFEKIQATDFEKRQKCLDLKINLFEIDVSKYIRNYDFKWNEIKSIIDLKLGADNRS